MSSSALRRRVGESASYVSRSRCVIRRILIAFGITLAVMAVLGVAYVLTIEHRYNSARTSAQLVRDRYTATGDELDLNPQQLPNLAQDLSRLESDLEELQVLVDAPVFGRIARHVPIVGNDVKATQQFVELGRELTAIASDATRIANDARLAFETSGMAVNDSATNPTWLDVVREQTPAIEDLERRMADVTTAREAINEQHLPANAQAMLPEVDRLISRATSIRDEYLGLLPMLDTAFGADGNANYVILLQNREELRPSGGFPGTFATITLQDGQLAAYDVYDIRTLDADDVARREIAIPSPRPIREVLGQAEYLPHDALWSPDFAESAMTFESMYSVAGWPEPVGVIGIDDSVVRNILGIVGPYEVVINGQTHTITDDNFMQLIESHRDLTWLDLTAHKQVVAVLGASLIERVKSSDFSVKKQIYVALREAANRRQLQIYLDDPRMQAEVTKRNWDGAIEPDKALPTLATTVAGLTGGKKALTIYQASLLEIAVSSNEYRVRWTITLDHRGDPNGNEVYNGYEYAWLSIYLPDGAQLISTSRDISAEDIVGDRRVTSFGIGIMPGTTEVTTIDFELAMTDRVLLRRQSGANDMQARIVGNTSTCEIDWSFTLSRDVVLDLSTCVTVPFRE